MLPSSTSWTSNSSQVFREPTIREQDAFLSGLGVDVCTTRVERVLVTDNTGFRYKDGVSNGILVMYYFNDRIALHWPENDYQELT